MTDLWDEIVGILISRFAGAKSVRELKHYIDIRDGKHPRCVTIANDTQVATNPDVLRRCLMMLGVTV